MGPPVLGDSGRLPRLTRLLNSVLQGKKTVSDSRLAEQFLESLTSQPDRSKTVEKLVASSPALDALEKSLRYDTSPTFINKSGAQLLNYLADPELACICNGQFLRRILSTVVDPPTFWTSLVAAHKTHELIPLAVQSFAWLIWQLMAFQVTEPVDLDEVATQLTENRCFIDSDTFDIRVIGQRIKEILALKSSKKFPNLTGYRPGGRHDNDFADFRSISILPTADELSSTEMPYYRRTTEIATADTESRIAQHLDNQFRLLREDMLGELRADIQNALSNGKGNGRRPPLIIEGLSVENLDCGDSQRRKPCGLTMRLDTDFSRLRSVNPCTAEARKAWIKSNPDFVRHGSFGCLIRASGILAFGYIERNENQLAENPPMISLQIANEAAFGRALLAAKSAQKLKFVQVDTPMFAYQPILHCLQSKTELALTNELFPDSFGQEESLIKPTRLLQKIERGGDGDLQEVLKTSKSITLDKSQLESLVTGLVRPLNLIQGPPGTGKSFIGALILLALLNNSSEKILVLTYKNHALDQFLGDLMDIGIPSELIVRLGSRTKCSAKTEPLLLFNQAYNYRRSQDSWNIIDQLKSQASKLEDQAKELMQAYCHARTGFSELMEMLEFSEDHSDFFYAFMLPEQVEGMELVGARGKAISSSYLFDRWKIGQDQGIFKSNVEYPHVWKMEKDARVSLLETWKLALLFERAQAIQAIVTQYNTVERKLNEHMSEKNRLILRSKRIIGCTTTAAAKYSQEIQAASPGIIIVEEAGEILESHILTALSANTKHLVLIGDHKQLRPKVNNYSLTVEQGSGYNLNVSLFERLVLSGAPHTTLLKQHRMAPEISLLVRTLTYPDLIDAPGTLSRAGLRGFQNRVIFVNHSHLEFEATHIAEKKDSNAKASKQNPFEANMVLQIIRYLAQQGYGSESIVVLTPYLGQLSLLRDMLSKSNDPVLNDLDTYDLVQAGLLPGASATGSKQKIKLSTIDNFQGDESEIVVASLTRSNANSDIGFMAAPERLNVLLSRARDGLIMIGNHDTFLSSRKGKLTWQPLIDKLKSRGCIYDGVPVACRRHPDRKAILQSPEDFNINCPDGGCSQPCGATLNCGVHKCPQRCHQLNDHSQMDCKQIIEFTCPIGHKSKRNCFQGSNKSCRKCDEEARAIARRMKRDFDLERDRNDNQFRYSKQLADIQDEIAHEKRQAGMRSDAVRREQAIVQAKEELEDLKRVRARVEVEQPAENCKTSTNSNFTTKNTQTAGTATKQLQTIKCQTKTSRVPSNAEEEWLQEKEMRGSENAALDSLMKLIGLEAVKEQFLTIKSKVDLVVRQGASLNNERFSAALLGNPGTGKTTVARIYGKFLSSVGVLPGSHFIETTGSKLANGGINECKKYLDDIQNQGGGVLFIDEAYQLVSGNSFGGKGVLDFLLTEIENLTGKVVFVLAGYTKEMEAFFAHNPGIPSRIPITLNFNDYNDKELLQILESGIEHNYKGGMWVEGGFGGLYLRIVARRIGTGRGREGFGNARAVHNALAKIADRQAKRFRAERKHGKTTDVSFLTKEDLIGPEPAGALKNNASWNKLQSLVGLKSVKDSVRGLLRTLQTNFQMEMEEKPYVETSLNRLFLGSPGTGKTSIAKLYAQILADIGILSSGEVVVKNPADFVGSVLGQSEANTKAILQSTIGKVLVIDEAYMLHDSSGADSYSRKVIDTIVAEVQSTPGEDRCVLLLGYKEQMEEMLQSVNPGLARRFPVSNAFYFEDFDDSEMEQIFDLKLKLQGFRVSRDTRKVVMEILSRARNQPHFGNAGEVDILLNRAKDTQQLRTSKAGVPHSDLLESQDFDPDFDRGERAATNCRMLFKGVVGCDEVITKLEGYQKIVANMRSLGEEPRQAIPFNFLFRGPPGTGKTTTANKMGKVFYDLGFLSKAVVIECSASDLIGQYVGQTGPKTQKLLESALGKVLFIDEAYRLAGGGFAKEAMDELVDCLTKPQFAQKLIVILAGYDDDINQLMAMNPGLTSRFPEAISFASLTPEHCLDLLTKQLQLKKKLDITRLEDLSLADRDSLLGHFEQLSKLSGWGNGRDVGTLAKAIYGDVIKSMTVSKSDSRLHLDLSWVYNALESMIKERANRTHSVQKVPMNQLDLPFRSKAVPDFLQQQLHAPPSANVAQSTSTDTATAHRIPCTGASIAHKHQYGNESRDAGVSDAIWAQLQEDVQRAKSEGAEYQRLKSLEAALQEQNAEAAAEREDSEMISPEDDEEHRRLEKERLARAKAKRERDAEIEKLVRKQMEMEEERKKEQAAQKKLKDLGICPAGYRWIKQSDGYRCSAGGHWVSNAQLGL